MNARLTKLAPIALLLAARAFPQAAAQDGGGNDAVPSGLAPLAAYRTLDGRNPDADPRGVAPPAAAARAAAPDLSAFGTVPVMPAFRVIEPAVHVFRGRDLYTRDGMIAQSFRRHPGLLVGNAFNLNRDAAHELYLEDDWRATKSDYWDMAHAMAQGGDPGAGRLILEEVNDEDLRLRDEAEQDPAAPALGRFQIASAQTGTRSLEISEIPINIPFVRISW